jgi:4-carboxymuconolactone decarboxylase
MKRFASAVTAVVVMTASTVHAEGTTTKEELVMVAPALEKYREQTLFGDVWKRPGLTRATAAS